MKRLLLIVFFSFFLTFTPVVAAQPTDTDIDKTIQELQAKIVDLQGQKTTLSKEIALKNSQIALLQLKMSATKAAIAKLNTEIDELTKQIDELEQLKTRRLELALHRAPESYKRRNVSLIGFLLLSQDFSDALSRMKYLARVQQEDARLYKQLQLTQSNYNERKDAREKKKAEQETLKRQLEQQTKQLNNQKKDKEILLSQTKNSEAVYQQLLARALAEKQAIQAILVGGGSEVEVGNVNAGDKIASIIEGQSCNSSGKHVHFIVSRNNNPDNPFNYLKGVPYENCSGYSCGDGIGDQFNPSGTWEWPIDTPVKFLQGYGSTWAINHTWVGRIYQFHNGIDISASSPTVKAVQPGILYRGSYIGYNGCSLKYVKVDHKDSDLNTYYLHVNYF